MFNNTFASICLCCAALRSALSTPCVQQLRVPRDGALRAGSRVFAGRGFRERWHTHRLNAGNISGINMVLVLRGTPWVATPLTSVHDYSGKCIIYVLVCFWGPLGGNTVMPAGHI